MSPFAKRQSTRSVAASSAEREAAAVFMTMLRVSLAVAFDVCLAGAILSLLTFGGIVIGALLCPSWLQWDSALLLTARAMLLSFAGLLLLLPIVVWGSAP